MRSRSKMISGRRLAWLLAVLVLGIPVVMVTMTGSGCGGDSGGGSSYTAPDPLTPLYWPGFRGPDGQGTVADTALTAWDESAGVPNGILWKTAVPRRGASSPVVCGGKIFLSGADAATREVYGFDAAAGTPLWQTAVATGSSPVQTIVYDGGTNITYAASTVVSDGINVYAVFGNGDVAAVDHNGILRWARSLGLPSNIWGHASSLVLYGNLLIVQLDQEKEYTTEWVSHSRLLALNTANGVTVWENAEAERPVGASWSTPIIINAASKDQLIACGGYFGGREVFAYDPATGTEYWSCTVLGSADIVVTPVFLDGAVIVLGAAGVAAIDPAGSGDVTATHILWTQAVGSSDVGGIVGSGQTLFVVNGYSGNATCLDTATDGTELWTQALGGNVLAAPIMINGNVYVQREDGTMNIFRNNAGAYAAMGTGFILDSYCSASPAVADGYIYIRSKDFLYCIGN